MSFDRENLEIITESSQEIAAAAVRNLPMIMGTEM